MNQIILMQLWCGMHRTCKNTSVKPDRSSWKIRSEKLLEGNLSTSLLDESNHSDAARSSSIDSVKWSDCGDRVKPCTGVVRKRHGGSWVSHVPLQKIDMKNEIWSRYVKGTSPFDITVTSGRLRWHRNQSHTCAPCWIHTYIHKLMKMRPWVIQETEK